MQMHKIKHHLLEEKEQRDQKIHLKITRNLVILITHLKDSKELGKIKVIQVDM